MTENPLGNYQMDIVVDDHGGGWGGLKFQKLVVNGLETDITGDAGVGALRNWVNRQFGVNCRAYRRELLEVELDRNGLTLSYIGQDSTPQGEYDTLVRSYQITVQTSAERFEKQKALLVVHISNLLNALFAEATTRTELISRLQVNTAALIDEVNNLVELGQAPEEVDDFGIEDWKAL